MAPPGVKPSGKGTRWSSSASFGAGAGAEVMARSGSPAAVPGPAAGGRKWLRCKSVRVRRGQTREKPSVYCGAPPRTPPSEEGGTRERGGHGREKKEGHDHETEQHAARRGDRRRALLGVQT